MIENADQANELKKLVDKNAEIEAAAQKAKGGGSCCCFRIGQSKW